MDHMNKNSFERLLKPDEVAKLLGVSDSWLSKSAATREWPAVPKNRAKCSICKFGCERICQSAFAQFNI